MHDYLFEHQTHLQDADLQRYALELGLGIQQFEQARTSPDIGRRIHRDLDSGERSGVEGTPTFYVNGIQHDGGYDLKSLRAAIVAAMQRGANAH